MTTAALTVEQQARKIEEDCERGAIRDALVSAKWYRWNLRLGMASTITAATAGFTAANGSEIFGFLSGHEKIFVSFFALLSAVLASTLTFLSPSEKANAFQQSSNKYHSLRERIRFFINNRDAQAVPDKESQLQLQKIILEKQEIDADHPILPEWAYTKAHEKIKEKIKRNMELKQMRDSERCQKVTV